MNRPRYLAAMATTVICSLVAARVGLAEARPVQLQAADGYPIKISYYPVSADANVPGGKQNAPVVVLLHGGTGNRLQWDKGTPFPETLQKTGYAVITVDLRKHGESVVEGAAEKVFPNDYEKMVLGDMAAVKNFIFEEHEKKNLNMTKMAIVAADMSAPIALAYSELDWKMPPYDDSAIPANRTPRGQDVRALVLISPEGSSGTVHATRSLAYLKDPRLGVALQVVVGAEDTEGLREARRMFQVFSSVKQNEGRVELHELQGVKDHGMALPMKYKAAVLTPIHKFLDAHVKELNLPWQERRSRLQR